MGKTKRLQNALRIKAEATISEETLLKVKSLPRINYTAYKTLIDSKEIKPINKLKYPRTIFFDEENNIFLYLNPVHLKLYRCGEFINKEIICE